MGYYDFSSFGGRVGGRLSGKNQPIGRGMQTGARLPAGLAGLGGTQYLSADFDAKKSVLTSILAGVPAMQNSLKNAIATVTSYNNPANGQILGQLSFAQDNLSRAQTQAAAMLNTATPAAIPSNISVSTQLWIQADQFQQALQGALSDAGAAVVASQQAQPPPPPQVANQVLSASAPPPPPVQIYTPPPAAPQPPSAPAAPAFDMQSFMNQWAAMQQPQGQPPPIPVPTPIFAPPPPMSYPQDPPAPQFPNYSTYSAPPSMPYPTAPQSGTVINNTNVPPGYTIDPNTGQLVLVADLLAQLQDLQAQSDALISYNDQSAYPSPPVGMTSFFGTSVQAPPPYGNSGQNNSPGPRAELFGMGMGMGDAGDTILATITNKRAQIQNQIARIKTVLGGGMSTTSSASSPSTWTPVQKALGGLVAAGAAFLAYKQYRRHR